MNISKFSFVLSLLLSHWSVYSMHQDVRPVQQSMQESPSESELEKDFEEYEDFSWQACSPFYARVKIKDDSFQKKLASFKAALAKNQAVFQSNSTTCGQRLKELSNSKIFCCFLPCNQWNNCVAHYDIQRDPSIGDVCCCLWATGATPVGMVGDVVTSPMPLSYVCCNATCSKKFYRTRLEYNLAGIFGLKRK